jgi:hypothetical protein
MSATRNQLKYLPLPFVSQAAISAFAQNSASSSLGLRGPQSRSVGRIEESALRGLREKFENGLATEMRPGRQTGTRMS